MNNTDTQGANHAYKAKENLVNIADIPPERLMAHLTFDRNHLERIVSHYAHAREKHPYFCDAIAPVDLDEARREGTLADYQENTSHSLATVRDNVACDAQNGRLTWEMLLLCEIWETSEAIAKGDTAHAVEECYDAIAVLLRTVDMLEGRQKLGKPEEGVAE